MPSLFITITKTERAQLCVSQQPLQQTLENLRSWPYSHNHQLYVFEARVLPTNAYGSSQYGQPKGCAELAMVAKINPEDKVENYQFLLGNELDELPLEQAVLRTQQVLDHLSKKLLHYEQTVKAPAIKEVENEPHS